MLYYGQIWAKIQKNFHSAPIETHKIELFILTFVGNVLIRGVNDTYNFFLLLEAIVHDLYLIIKSLQFFKISN